MENNNSKKVIVCFSRNNFDLDKVIDKENVYINTCCSNVYYDNKADILTSFLDLFYYIDNKKKALYPNVDTIVVFFDIMSIIDSFKEDLTKSEITNLLSAAYKNAKLCHYDRPDQSIIISDNTSDIDNFFEYHIFDQVVESQNGDNIYITNDNHYSDDEFKNIVRNKILSII